MAEYKLKNGYVLTDAEIEARAMEWEDGTWRGPLVDISCVGKSAFIREMAEYKLKNGYVLTDAEIAAEPLANMSFKCPESHAEMIAKAAEISGVGKSAFIREAAVEKAVSILATAS